jgi:Copper(I)-binding protein CorA
MQLLKKLIISTFLLTVTTYFITAEAATRPARMLTFDAQRTKAVFGIKRAAWRDPLFGNEGWTHSSDWGKFTAKKGQIIKITLATAVQGLHPGISVWFRGTADTAPDNYIADHFYPQNQSIIEKGAKDESSGKVIGNIVMQIVDHAFDNDGHTEGYGLKRT